MPQSRDIETLLDIERAAPKVIQFKQGFDRDAFLDDEKTQSAIVFQLLILGEATKRLSTALREQYSDVPWSLIAGMRDKLIHDYDEIDIEEVWKTANTDVPDLLISVQAALENSNNL